MKDIKCKDCLWCATTFLMLKYQEEHTFCHLRSSLLDKSSISRPGLLINQDNNFVQLNLFDL